MKLFLGEYKHGLDDRGRVILPRKMRQEIERAEIILARGYDGCIFGFDRTSWEKEAEKHISAPITDKESLSVRRYLFSGAEQVEVDKLGRILLPGGLKDHAGIQKNIYIVGAGDHFEIWDEKRWEAYEKTLKRP